MRRVGVIRQVRAALTAGVERLARRTWCRANSAAQVAPLSAERSIPATTPEAFTSSRERGVVRPERKLGVDEVAPNREVGPALVLLASDHVEPPFVLR